MMENTKLMKKDTQISEYYQFPKFLLETNLSQTEKLVYMLLVDRCRLSQKNKNWIDDNGYVFCKFSKKNLAKKIKKSESTVKNALKALEDEQLIVRKNIVEDNDDNEDDDDFKKKSNLIYVKLPESASKQKNNCAGAKNCPEGGYFSGPYPDKKVPPNNNTRNNYKSNSKSKASSSIPKYDTQYQDLDFLER